MVLSFLLTYSRAFYSLDKLISDPLYQTASQTDNAIHIIAIDEQTIAKYGEPSTWSRDILGQLVETLNQDESTAPAVIVVDMILTSDKDEAGDLRLADACRMGNNVITAANLVYRDEVTVENGTLAVDSNSVSMVEYPYDALRHVSSYGFANTIQEQDGYIRSAMISQSLPDGSEMYSLAYMAYMNYCTANDLQIRDIDTYRNNTFYFQYSGKPSDATTHSYEIVSMSKILDGTVDPKVYAGSIVMIGAFAPGMGDAYNVAIQHGQQMYGVEIHANILEALLEGRTQVPLDTLYYALIVMLLALLYYLLCDKLKVLPSTILMIAFIAADLIAGKILYQNGIIVSVIELPIFVIVIYAYQLIRGYLFELLRKRQVLNAFKKYVAPQVVDEISKKGEFRITLGGENRNIACLFVDIRGFTPMSEGLKPEQVVEILNEYLTLTTNSIFKNNGTLDKFVGDATMAVFNAPFDLDDYIYRAVCTARDIAAGSEELEKKLMDRFGKSVSFGIGVNCGEATVGNIGCDFRMDYTAIGDTVNTSARLEANAGRGQILISQDVYEAVADRVRVTPCGNIPLKGKSAVLYVFQVDQVLDTPMTDDQIKAARLEDLAKTIAPTKNTPGGGHLIIDEEGNITGETET